MNNYIFAAVPVGFTESVEAHAQDIGLFALSAIAVLGTITIVGILGGVMIKMIRRFNNAVAAEDRRDFDRY